MQGIANVNANASGDSKFFAKNIYGVDVCGSSGEGS